MPRSSYSCNDRRYSQFTRNTMEIFVIHILTALKPSLEHDRKQVLRLLRLFRDQAIHGIVHFCNKNSVKSRRAREHVLDLKDAPIRDLVKAM